MTIIFGALAAGVAWVVFTIIPDTWRAARTPVVIVAALLGGLNGWSRFDRNEMSDVERELVESEQVGELARAFRDAQPAEFAAYVDDIRAAMEGGAASDAMARASLRLQLAAENRLASMPDADIAEYHAIRRDAVLELRSTNPAGCKTYLHGGPEVGAHALPGDAIAQRQMQLYARAFRNENPVEHVAFPNDEWPGVLDGISEQTFAIVGDDIGLLAPDADTSGREARSCDVIAEWFNQLSLTPQQGRVFVTMQQQYQADL